MDPNIENWKPKHVTIPSDPDPSGHLFFNWTDPKLQKWKMDAIKMQEAHVKDNSRTEWFSYQPEDRDAIELRILTTVYGIPDVQNLKGVPYTLLKIYNRDQRKHAKKLQKIIIQYVNKDRIIYFNVIYISTATMDDGGEFLASEIPVFAVKYVDKEGKNMRKFVDVEGNKYEDFEDYKERNNLPQGPMIYPKNGSYTPNCVPLEGGEAWPIQRRVTSVVTKAVFLVGLALTGSSVAIACKPALFGAKALQAINCGSYVCSAFSFLGAVKGIYNKTSTNESIETEVLIILSVVFTTFSNRLNSHFAKKLSPFAQEGKTYESIKSSVTRFQKGLLCAVNMFTLASSSAAFSSAMWDFLKKLNQGTMSWMDLFQMAMSGFMYLNVLARPLTIKGIFESEQMRFLDSLKEGLGSEEAKESMKKTLKEHKTSDERAYFIRTCKKVTNPTEFFELIGKTDSTVKFTADGMVINNQITISAEAYNTIGIKAIEQRINKLRQSIDAYREKSLNDMSKSLAPSDQIENLKNEQKRIRALPKDQQKDALKAFLQEHDPNLTDKQFDEKYKNAIIEADNQVDEAVKKTFRHLSTFGANEQDRIELAKLEKRENNNTITPEEQKKLSSLKEKQQICKDFDELTEITKKEINGSINDEEKRQMAKLKETCSRHRKENFFEGTSRHKSDPNYKETWDQAERDACEGKTREEWLAESKNSSTNCTKEAIDDGINKANGFRKHRREVDKFISDPNMEETESVRSACGGKTSSEWKAQQQQFEAAGNTDAARAAQAKSDNAKILELMLKSETTQKARELNKDIQTFTSAQNERLCYQIDCDSVTSNLQEAFGTPDLSTVTINRLKVFENMKISDYDRLNRVLDNYGDEKKAMLDIAKDLANDPDFTGDVKSVDEVAALMEAIDCERNKIKSDAEKAVKDAAEEAVKAAGKAAEEAAKAAGQTAEGAAKAAEEAAKAATNANLNLKNKIAEAKKKDVKEFMDAMKDQDRTRFNKYRDKLNLVLEEVRQTRTSHEWTSDLSKAYHFLKHGHEFGATMKAFFNEHASNIFSTENEIGRWYSQDGSAIHTSYARSFGTRIHVGFGVTRNNEIIVASHFAPTIR